MSKSLGLSRKLRRYICMGMLAAMAPFALGCYGHFPLTRAVYRMNGNVGSDIGEDRTARHLVETGIMWILIIVPVYEVAIFADAVILNLIQFWTGDVQEIGMVQERDGAQVALAPGVDGREAVLTVSRDGKTLTQQHVVKISANAFEMRDASGHLTGTILKTPAGAIQLSDGKGRIIRTLAAEDLAALPRS